MSHSSASTHAHAAPTPYRIPIELLHPGTTAAHVPDFHVCLIDQLLTPEQRAEKRRALKAGGITNTADGLHPNHVAAAAVTAHGRPVHDRLPLLMAISSRDPVTMTAAAPSTASAAPAEAPPCGVNFVTLLQPADAARWHAAREERTSITSATVARTVVGTTNKPHSVVHTHQVTLSHASRCPCRAPITANEDGENEEVEAAASAVSVAPSLHQPQLRLAVVVVPTLYSLSHCASCRTDLPADTAPCLRVLVTRRPSMMRAFPGSWVFPGGACDPTDLSLAHTGLRELREETGLDLLGLRPGPDSEDRMHIVSLWEAVYPVIRPSTLPRSQPFTPKARYLIVMFACEINTKHLQQQPIATATATASGQHEQQGPNATPPSSSAASSPTSTASATSSASPSRPSPTCLCSVPLRLCSTEVDAAVWLSGTEFDELQKHAAYFHTDSEADLQQQHQQHQSHPHPSSHSPHPSSSQQQSDRCEAGTEVCSCPDLPAFVTHAYAEKHRHHTQMREAVTVASHKEASTPAASSSPSSSSTPAAALAAPAASAFLPATIRSCALYGLYPNRHGSGFAEGHLVALEEMRATGRF